MDIQSPSIIIKTLNKYVKKTYYRIIMMETLSTSTLRIKVLNLIVLNTAILLINLKIINKGNFHYDKKNGKGCLYYKQG